MLFDSKFRHLMKTEVLENIGFKLCGNWSSKIGQLKFQLTEEILHPRFLYCFVTLGEVMYIGSGTNALSAEMEAIRSSSSISNTSISGKLSEHLRKAGGETQIFAFADPGKLSYAGVKVDLAGGLIDSLTLQIRPVWNTGVTTSTSTIKIDNSEATTQETLIPMNNVFPITLGATYYRGNFFNVGVQWNVHFGPHGSVVTIEIPGLGTIQGTVNRTANTNGTPRIMIPGNTGYLPWLQKNFNQRDLMRIEVLAKNRIRITK